MEVLGVGALGRVGRGCVLMTLGNLDGIQIAPMPPSPFGELPGWSGMDPGCHTGSSGSQDLRRGARCLKLSSVNFTLPQHCRDPGTCPSHLGPQ